MKAFSLLPLFALIACVKTGGVAERQPVASVASYKSASVSITSMPSDLQDANDRKGELREALIERLNEEHVFGSIVPEGGDNHVALDVLLGGLARLGAVALMAGEGRVG